VVLTVPCAAVAQRPGQNASISVRTVVKVESIDLRSQNAPAGALVGRHARLPHHRQRTVVHDIIEEAKDQASVRRAGSSTCRPESADAVASPDVQEELREQAAECLAAKEAMLAAETEEPLHLAQRKMDFFRNE